MALAIAFLTTDPTAFTHFVINKGNGIINHWVPLEVLDNVHGATHRFFGLPAEEKNKYSKDYSSSNSVRFGTSFRPQAEKALSGKIYLRLFSRPEVKAAALWPPACGDEVLEFMKGSEVMIKQLLQVLMKRLNINEIDETKKSLLIGLVRVNLIKLLFPFSLTQGLFDMIGHLPEMLANDEKPIYKQVLYSNYVKHFCRKAHDGKGTVGFAKIST
ncbi:hypothetical protein SLE2022_300820 [Rubroshorea leprosula]